MAGVVAAGLLPPVPLLRAPYTQQREASRMIERI